MPSSTQPRQTETREVRFPGGCIVCGADLEVRIGDGWAASYCRACRWVSRPLLCVRGAEIRLLHPPGANA